MILYSMILFFTVLLCARSYTVIQCSRRWALFFTVLLCARRYTVTQRSQLRALLQRHLHWPIYLITMSVAQYILLSIIRYVSSLIVRRILDNFFTIQYGLFTFIANHP